MTKLATICYILIGKNFTVITQQKSQTMSMRANTLALIVGKFKAAETPEEVCERGTQEETGLTATKMEMKGDHHLSEFTPGHD